MVKMREVKTMKLSCRTTSLMTVGLLVGMFAAPVLAQKKSRMQDAARHASEAAETFTEVMNVREKSIPKELLDKAEAIAVFPGVVKAAFIVGGRGGQGVISSRVKGGWRAPGFFNLAGGSFGVQIGAQKPGYVLAIRIKDGVNGRLKDKLQLSAGIQV